MHTLFERVLAHEPSDSVVWTADLEYWISGREEDGTADPSWRTDEGFLELCRSYRVVPYYYYGNFWLAEARFDRTVEISMEKEGRRTRKIFRTPKGDLCEETSYMPESCSVAQTRFAVQNENDLEIFAYMMKHRSLVPAAIQDYPKRLSLYRSYGGLPSIALPRSPLSAFLYEWAGVLNGVYLILDCPEIIAETFSVMQEQEEPVLDAVCESAPPLVHFAENLSSDTMGGFYSQYMEEIHAHRLERLHAAGIACAVHLDGVVRGLLPRLAAIGFDAIEALTPQPGGDMRVEDMRDVCGNDSVILWGGVPGVLFSPPYRASDIESHVRRVLAAWKGTPFILGVADQIPANGNIEYCRLIADICAAES
jgi:hypothetical protein